MAIGAARLESVLAFTQFPASVILTAFLHMLSRLKLPPSAQHLPHVLLLSLASSVALKPHLAQICVCFAGR